MGKRRNQRTGRNNCVPHMVVTAIITLTLGGCANFSADGGMLLVQDHSANALNADVVKIRTEAEAAEAQARVKALLAKPMTVEAAVQIALLNNRGLQAAYNELGVSEAQMVEASLPPAPSISLARLTGAELEVERQIVQSVLGLLTLPRRREIAEDKFRQAQSRAVQATLRTATEARRSYYRAVSSGHIVKFLEEARLSAEAVSQLAKKLGETGALPKIDQAREHAFYTEVSGQLALARLKQRSEREKLNRALGLWGEQTKFRLPGTLKSLPATPKSEGTIETRAVTSRVDLEIARMDLELLAKQYGLTRATRFIDVLKVSGLSRNTIKSSAAGKEKSPREGFNVEFEIPIYDFGEARSRLAEESYMQSVNRLIEKAVSVRSEAREAYVAYRGAFDIARYYETEILPLREIISQQELLAYNGMLSDLFSLLNDSRARVAANVQAIEAKRDFWLAAVDLQAAVIGGSKSDDGSSQSAAMARGAGE